MLNGLEAVELKLSEVLEDNNSFRFDSEYVKKEFLHTILLLERKRYSKLSEITNKISVGYVGSMVNEYSENGITLLQTKNIDEIFLNEKDLTYINDDFHIKLKKSQIYKNDILVARSGSFGKASIYLDNIVINSSDIIIIQTKILDINPFYLTVFLNTIYGKNQLFRFASGGLQGHVNLTILENLLVPIPLNNFQEQIEKLVKSAYQKLEDSKNLYKEAEDLLLKELDLVDFVPSDENISIKSFKDSFMQTGRFDSEYYQVKYDEIEKIIEEQGNYTYIKNEFNHIKTSFDKSKNGYNYIEIGNVNVSDGTNISNYVETQDLPANAKINVKNGDLLVSTVRPYRGAVTIIDTSENDLIVSGAFTVLRKKENSKINTQVLQVLLRTNIYKELLLKYNVGTQYPVIKDEDVLNLIIPNIDETIQTQIEEKIKKSFVLKEQSKKLLDLAKRAVEVAIEKNEDEAMEFINAQV